MYNILLGDQRIPMSVRSNKLLNEKKSDQKKNDAIRGALAKMNERVVKEGKKGTD
jgi:hypothetical protein